MGYYGLLMVAGIALGAWVVRREGPRVGVSGEQALDLVFWVVLGGLAGARLLHVAVEWRLYYGLCVNPDQVLGHTVPCGQDSHCLMAQRCVEGVCHTQRDCLAALKFWQGGWTFLGGFLGGWAAALVYCRHVRMGLWRGLGLLAVGLPLGHAIGRVGCLVEGCCYGKTTTGWLAVEGRVPTQAMEALGNLLVFLITLKAFRSQVAKHASALDATDDARGWAHLRLVLAVYAISYGILRFVLEVFRGDSDRGYLMRFSTPDLASALGFSSFEPLFLSTSQAISLGLILAGLILVLFTSVKQKN